MEEPDRARGRVTASRIDSWWVKRLSGHGRGKSRGKSVIKKSRRLRVSIQYADIRHISLYIVVLGGLSSPTLYTVGLSYVPSPQTIPTSPTDLVNSKSRSHINRVSTTGWFGSWIVHIREEPWNTVRGSRSAEGRTE